MFIRVLKPFFFLAIVIVLVGTACMSNGGETPVPEEPQANLPQAEEPAADAPGTRSGGSVNTIEDVESAVFQIIGTGTINTIDDGEVLNSEWGGTGFFIDPSGIAVTNNHVVAGAAVLKAYVSGESSPKNITVLGTAECADLAVIKVQGDGYPYLSWYDGSVKNGLEVYAAGFPLLDPQYNLTKGIISKVNADGQTSWASLDYIYGHDAKINGGNSGGPLVTADGQVVGINYSSAAQVDQNFAIPVDLALPILDKLQNGEDVDSLGMYGYAVVFGPNQEYPGIWVESVTTGGTIDKAGILPGDIIHEVEGILVATDGTMQEYCDIVKGHNLDDPMKVMVYRYGTDELLEGSLNETPMEVTASGVLGTGASSGGSSSSGGSQSNSNGIATEFENSDLESEGWYKYIWGDSQSEGTVEQRPGRMIVSVDTTATEVYVFNESFSASDVILKTTVTKVAGPNRMNASLVCRASDAGWYEFAITYGGYVQVWKWDANAGDNGYFYQLAERGSTAIRVETGGVNTLEAHCIGNNLTFYVNDIKVADVTDRDFAEGQVGVGVYAFDIRGPEVEFENFFAEPQ